MQLPLFEPQSAWRPPSLGTLPSWADAKRICVDVETKDPHLKELGPGVRRGSHICGFSFRIEDGPKAYLPLRHEGGDNMEDPDAARRYIRENAKSFKGDLVGANLSYDLDFCWQEDIFFPQVRYYRDIQIADPLINELENQRSLDAICKRLGLPGKNQSMLEEAARAFGVDPKGGMYKLAARYVGEYAETDTEQPLLALRKQERIIDDRDLWNVYNLESQVLPVLVRMRRRGVRVDVERLRKVETWSIDQETEALAIVRDHTGVRINVGDVWKPKALVPALEHIGIRIEKNAKGQPVGIDQELFAGDHPVLKAIGRARKVNKLRTTFAASIRKHMTNGRIHCTFNQIAGEQEDGETKGARYGRLSCTNPNMQQQPSRDEFASMWRSIYIPEEGALWASKDYSQQEPRWTTHFAAVCNLEGGREAAKAYHDDPLLDNHQFMADLTGLPRKYAKNIYLGLCYGEGGAKLCRELGLPTRWALSVGKGRERQVIYRETYDEILQERANHVEGFMWEAAGSEGQTILDTFDNRAPFIRKLAKFAEDTAKKRGHIITAGGRHMHFELQQDGTYRDTRKALNRLIQGTSADQTKLAIVELDKTDLFMQLQVHDELDSSVGSVEEAERAAKVMRECMPSLVPFRVDVECGPSWGEIK